MRSGWHSNGSAWSLEILAENGLFSVQNKREISRKGQKVDQICGELLGCV